MDRLREVHLAELAERFAPLRTSIIQWSLAHIEQLAPEDQIPCFLEGDNERMPPPIGDDSVDAFVRKWRSDYHFDQDESTLEILDDD